jgi:hypothetical protein
MSANSVSRGRHKPQKENGMWKYSDNNTFRMGPIQIVKNSSGKEIGVRECQELIDGRWEPFITNARPNAACLIKQG